MENQSLHYDAFISYRHSPLDQKVAAALHRKLENYTLPKAVAKKIGKNRLERVFRDKAELSVSSELSEAINEALIHSDYLIVICSPRLPESVWCMKEVETFLKLKGRDHILLVLIEGEPEDSFPEILLYEDVIRKDDTGAEITVREHREPLAAECRGNTPKELKKAVNDTTIRLCAAMFGVNYDDLKQRHREATIRRRALFGSLIIVVLLLIIFQNTFFLARLSKQNRIIEEKLADSTASDAEELLADGRTMDALYAARSVLPKDPSKGYNANAFRSLVDATGIYSTPTKYKSKKILTFPSTTMDAKYSSDGRYAAALDYTHSYILYVLDTSNPSDLYIYPKSKEDIFLSYTFDDENGLLIAGGESITYYNPEDKSEQELIHDTGTLFPSGDYSVTLMASQETLYGISKGTVLYSKELKSLFPDSLDDIDNPADVYANLGVNNIFPSFDGKYAVILFRNYNYVDESEDNVFPRCCLACINARTGEPVYCKLTDSDIMCAYFDGEFLYILENTNENGIVGNNLKKIDIRKNKAIRSITFDGEYFYDLYYLNNYFLVSSTSRLVLLNDNLTSLESLGIESTLSTAFLYDGKPSFFLTNGKMYTWEEAWSAFYESDDFVWRGDSYLFCHYYNGIIFAQTYNTDFITVFEQYSSPYITDISDSYVETDSEESYDYEILEAENAEKRRKAEELFALVYPGKTLAESDHVIESDDDKYFAIQNSDKKTEIFDRETLECVFSSYNITDEISNFFFMESDNVYVISDYSGISIFTPDYKYISRIDGLVTSGKNIENGHLVLNDLNSIYELRIASYDEVMKIADEMLGDYVPDGKIMEKYGLE